MRVGHDYPQSYETARSMLGDRGDDRGHRVLSGVNTMLVAYTGGYAVRYYSTDIVVFNEDGTINVSDYGSVTTNRKIKVIGGRNFHTYNDKRVTKIAFDGDKYTCTERPGGWTLRPKAK